MNRPNRSSLLGFATRFGLVFGVLMLPSSPPQNAYLALMRWLASGLFSTLPRYDVTFRPSGELNHVTDVFVREVATRDAWILSIPSGFTAYLPQAILLSLVLATPVPAMRRVRSALFGTALLLAYTTINLTAVFLIGLISHAARCPTPGLHPEFLTETWLWRCVSEYLNVVHTQPAVYCTLPVLAWLVTTFRDGDAALIAPVSPVRTHPALNCSLTKTRS